MSVAICFYCFSSFTFCISLFFTNLLLILHCELINSDCSSLYTLISFLPTSAHLFLSIHPTCSSPLITLDSHLFSPHFRSPVPLYTPHLLLSYFSLFIPHTPSCLHFLFYLYLSTSPCYFSSLLM